MNRAGQHRTGATQCINVTAAVRWIWTGQDNTGQEPRSVLMSLQLSAEYGQDRTGQYRTGATQCINVTAAVRWIWTRQDNTEQEPRSVLTSLQLSAEYEQDRTTQDRKGQERRGEERTGQDTETFLKCLRFVGYVCVFMCVYSSFTVVSVCLCSVYDLFSSVYCELGLILQAFDMHQDRQFTYNETLWRVRTIFVPHRLS